MKKPFLHFALAAIVCGNYQILDLGDRMFYTITDFTSKPGRQLSYTVTNPAGDVARSMIAGKCYCVEGQVFEDPEFLGDTDFHLIFIEQMSGAPYGKCDPP